MREHSIGTRVSATTEENATAAARVMPNSPKITPMRPGARATGRNTDTSTTVVAITAKPIWRLPSMAASSGGLPCSRWRTMFSSTTMASSTTRPMARTAASRVSVLMV